MASLLLMLAFLYSVHEGLLSDCPPEKGLLLLNSALLFPFHSLGIYLMHQGDCYLNGSYFYDSNIIGLENSVTCVLPNSTLDDGEWVDAPDGSLVNCNTDPLHCDAGSSPANISLYIEGGISPSDDGWYKCCLPTSCSDPNTNMITANIFSKCSHCTSTHCHLLLIYCRMGTD